MKFYGGLNPFIIDELCLDEINDYLNGINILLTEELQIKYDFTMLPNLSSLEAIKFKKHYIGDHIISDEEQVIATKDLANFCKGF